MLFHLAPKKRKGVGIDHPKRCPSYITGGQNTEFEVIKAGYTQTVCSEVAQCV